MRALRQLEATGKKPSEKEMPSRGHKAADNI
jgi:hypothetical protein